MIFVKKELEFENFSVFLKLKFMFIILRITIHKKKFSNKENGLYVKILQDTN